MATYPASNTQTVRIDADDPRLGGGETWTVQLPPALNGNWVEVLQTRQHATNPVTVQAQPGDVIDPIIYELPAAQTLTAHLQRACIRLTYQAAANAWLVTSSALGFPWVPVTVITAADSPYTMTDLEFVAADATAGPITINVPPALQRADGAAIRVKKTDPSDNAVMVSADGESIESGYHGIGTSASVMLLGQGACVEWQYDETNSTWLAISSSKLARYYEAWQGTPQAPMGSTIVWTFQPIYPGVTSPLLASHAAGLFTFLVEAELQLQLNAEVLQNLVGNNSDVDWSISPVITSANLQYFPRIIQSFAHSRAGSFPASAVQLGTLKVDAADTMQVDTSQVGDGSSTADLTSATLLFSV